MHRKIVCFINILLACLLISGCSGLQKSTPAAVPTTITPLASATQPVQSTPQPMATEIPQQTATPLPALERSRYTLNAVLDTASLQLTVDETIQYLNNTGQVLNELPLVVPANHVEGQFMLESLQLSNAPGDDMAYTLEDETLTIRLAEALQPDEILEISLSYLLNIPQQNGPFGYTGRQYNLADWYAFVPPYDTTDGWLINPYHAIGEYLVYDYIDFVVDLSLAQPDPAMIIAAGAPAETAENHWHYLLPEARTFVWSASEEFVVLQQAETANVTAYILPEHIEQGWSALATTISAMNLYRNLYGAYPHEILTLVEGDFYDGMEYDGLYFLGIDYFQNYKGGEQNYLTAIAAHETAHQWWFSAVGNNAAREPWLDESLAIYSELFFYETYYPGDEEWWWNFRVETFKPEGWVNSDVYEYSKFRPYINAVYLRGAQFLHEIRQTIGDDAFLAFLQMYYRQGQGKIMHGQDFLDLLSQSSNADMSPILEKYFR